MGGLNMAQFEKLAEGVADGLTQKAAALAAGYGEQSTSFYGVTKREDFIKRVAELRDERPWSASRELGPVILELRRCAKKAGEGTTAACMNAARGLLMAAAELKKQLPKEELRSGEREISLKEWAEERKREKKKEQKEKEKEEKKAKKEKEQP